MAENENAAAVADAEAPEEELQWEPDRAPEEYDDETLKATPLFDSIRESCAFSVGGQTRYLPDSEVLNIARTALKDIWEARESGQDSDDVLALFEKFIEREGEQAVRDANNTIICTRVEVGTNEDGPQYEGRAKLKSAGRGKRFGHDNYAALIGYGEDPESDLYKQAREKLGDRYEGGFVLHKTGMKKASKNGYYEFRILPPEKTRDGKDNEVCDKFVAELHQFPEDGRKVPTIRFPPRSGDKKDCEVSDNIVEVPSMSKMMKESELKGAQTPAVVYGLDKIQVEPDDNAEGENDNAKGDAPANAADALLADDDD